MTLPEWNPCLKESDFKYTGDLINDLCSFAEVYLKKVTPKMVKISLGLRSPDLYEITRDGIREFPEALESEKLHEIYKRAELLQFSGNLLVAKSIEACRKK